MKKAKNCKHYMIRLCNDEGHYQCEDCLKHFKIRLICNHQIIEGDKILTCVKKPRHKGWHNNRKRVWW